jgi:hypothetical protein
MNPIVVPDISASSLNRSPVRNGVPQGFGKAGAGELRM